MENLKKFLDKNFTIILCVFLFIMFMNDCSRARSVQKIQKDISAIKDSTYTKSEIKRELRIMGLETEKRFIQSTDRKLMDVKRQSEIDKELEKYGN